MKPESRMAFEEWAVKGRSKPMDLSMTHVDTQSPPLWFYQDLVTDACWEAFKKGHEVGYTNAINFISGSD